MAPERESADLHATAITLCQYHKVSFEVHALLESIVRVAEVSYLTDQERSPQAILCLYNSTWCHHGLLQHLIPHPNILSRQKLFGSYLHDVSCHVPPQFELVSLQSCNTEFEKRLFGQARQVPESCINCQLENILQQMFSYMHSPSATSSSAREGESQRNQVCNGCIKPSTIQGNCLPKGDYQDAHEELACTST